MGRLREEDGDGEEDRYTSEEEDSDTDAPPSKKQKVQARASRFLDEEAEHSGQDSEGEVAAPLGKKWEDMSSFHGITMRDVSQECAIS